MKFIPLFFLIFVTIYAKEPLSPIPLENVVDKQKALLGYRLFTDSILSSDNTVSCMSCHNIFGSGGADQNVVSIGVENKKGHIQAPTVLNAKYNFRQFWNGRAEDLAQQAIGPIHDPTELNMSRKDVENRLNASEEYKNLFFKVYKTDTIKFDQVIDAIVEFENALTTPNSKFDKYLRGEDSLTQNELEGYNIFKQIGCITCHNGINIGSNSMQKIGLFEEYKNAKNYPDLYSVTHDPAYLNVFKVPTLRNISKTSPYLHDGSAKTLKDAVVTMARYQLGTTLSDEEIDKIVKFLNTLNGQMPQILNEQL